MRHALVALVLAGCGPSLRPSRSPLDRGKIGYRGPQIPEGKLKPWSDLRRMQFATINQ